MRKISRLLAIMFICFASVLSTTACGVEIETMVVKPGTLETTVVKGENTLDTSNCVVVVTYSNDDVEEVTASELEFSHVDTTTTGNKTLKITYDDFSINVSIRVVATEEDVNSINMFEWDSQHTYETNIAKNPSEKTAFLNPQYDADLHVAEMESKYLGVETTRYVGTDNPFVMDINAAGENAAGEDEFNLQHVSTKVKVEHLQGSSYVELTGDDLAHYVTINTDGGAKFQFNPETAHGEIFRITVEPRNKAEDIQTDLSVKSIIKVIEGFNIHNEYELSVYDNSGRDYDLDQEYDWYDIKERAGVLNCDSTTFILQNDLNLKREHMPETMFWSSTKAIWYAEDYDEDESTTDHWFDVAQAKTNLPLEGSMIDRDFTGVYKRIVNQGDNIQFIGNYFTISAADVPKAVVEYYGGGNHGGIHVKENAEDSNEFMDAHNALFCNFLEDECDFEIPYGEDGHQCLGNDIHLSKDPNIKTSVKWRNVALTGNAPTGGNAASSGGLTMFKSYRVSTEVYNCNSNYFAVNYFFQEGEADNDNDGNYVIDSCKAYDSFQALLFLSGAEHVLLNNSEFVGSSGPACLSIHRHFDERDTDGDYPSCLDIVDSRLESLVTGREPWFANLGDKAVAMVMSMSAMEDLLLHPMIYTGKTNVVRPDEDDPELKLMNIMVISMAGEPDFEAATLDRPEGYTRVFGAFDGTFAGMKEYATAEKDIDEVTTGLNHQSEGAQAATYGLTMLEADNGLYVSVPSSSNSLPDEICDEIGAIVGGYDTQHTVADLFEDSRFLHLILANGMMGMMQLYPAPSQA